MVSPARRPRSDRALQRIRDAAGIAAELRDGSALRRYAESVLSDLPAGPVQLVAATVEGVAAAAAVATLRTDPTSWRRIRLTVVGDTSADVVYVIEPSPGGAGWRRAVLRRFPEARFLDASGDAQVDTHAARRTAAIAAAAA